MCCLLLSHHTRSSRKSFDNATWALPRLTLHEPRLSLWEGCNTSKVSDQLVQCVQQNPHLDLLNSFMPLACMNGIYDGIERLFLECYWTLLSLYLLIIIHLLLLGNWLQEGSKHIVSLLFMFYCWHFILQPGEIPWCFCFLWRFCSFLFYLFIFLKYDLTM